MRGGPASVTFDLMYSSSFEMGQPKGWPISFDIRFEAFLN